MKTSIETFETLISNVLIEVVKLTLVGLLLQDLQIKNSLV